MSKIRTNEHGRWQLYFTFSSYEAADWNGRASGYVCDIQEVRVRAYPGGTRVSYRLWLLLEEGQHYLPRELSNEVWDTLEVWAQQNKELYALIHNGEVLNG